MQLDDLILVSVDDHIIEPPDLFARHIPKKYAGREPKLLYDAASKTQSWVWEGGRATTTFMNAVVTLPKHEWGFDPSTLADIRPGCFDVKERVRDMDVNGVLASMNFPSFAGMAGNFFAACNDKELALACLRAYNDWHIDEWCASHPGRFIPLPLSPLWDPQAAADEVRRVAKKGATAITFCEDTEAAGFASIHTGAWDPFFEACSDEGVVAAIHIASAGAKGFDSLTTPMDVKVTLPCWNALPCLANLLWCKSLQKFPDFKVALSEGGTSWIPGFLDRMERHYSNQRWTGSDLGKLSPTETFRRHFLACFICDPSGLLLRDRIGVENIAYEVDYPHSDCTWPNSSEELWEHFELAKVPDAERRAISADNALRWLRFDPFKYVPKAQATVGALRAKARAAGVSLEMKSRDQYRRAWEAQHGAIA